MTTITYDTDLLPPPVTMEISDMREFDISSIFCMSKVIKSLEN